MQEGENEKVVKNTELIVDNTREIKETSVKNYKLERYRRIWEALFYTHQRIDILLISISGGGIYVCLETIKYLRDNDYAIEWTIKVSALAFVLSIVANFIGQMLSSAVHSCDYQISDIEVTCEEENVDSTTYNEKIKSLEQKIERLNSCHKWINWTSITLMSSGLILLIAFFLITF